MKTTINSLSKLSESIGIQNNRTYDANWINAQVKKFLRCPKCGKQMVYVRGTNFVGCPHCAVEDRRGKKPDFGFVRFLDKRGMGFSEFIFGEKDKLCKPKSATVSKK